MCSPYISACSYGRHRGDRLYCPGGDKSQNPAAMRLPGTRLITLGTSRRAVANQGSTQASNLLIVNGIRYLIDAGDNVTRRIVQSGSGFSASRENLHHSSPQRSHDGPCDPHGVRVGVSEALDPIDIYGPPGIEALVNGL